MKKSISILILSAILKIGAAQTVPTFSKLFVDSFFVSGGVCITSISDSIYFTRASQGMPNNFQAIDFIKTDESGNELNNYLLYRSNYIYSSGITGSLKHTTDAHLIFACEEVDSTYLSTAYLYRFDSRLSTLRKQAYSSAGKVISFFSSVELSDGNYLLAGSIQDTASYHNEALMIKTDTSGNIIWQRTMSSDILNGAAYTYPFPGGFYQYWAAYHNNVINDGVDSAMFIDRYDNNGNLQWRDTFGIVGNENVPGPFTGLKDGGGIIIVDALDTTSPINGLGNLPTAIYKFDSTGSIIWVKYLPSNAANSIIETHSGSIVMCGGGYDGFLIKVDKNGNTIFDQLYKYNDSAGPNLRNVLLDLTETADGGYAAIGNAFHQVGNEYLQAAWLLKVDSNGCLNGDCPQIQTGIKDIPVIESFFVFPNPATSQFNVALAGPNDLDNYHDLYFTMYDLTGRKVYSQALIEQTTRIARNELPQGIYIWHIADGDMNLTNGKMVLK